MLSEKQKQLFDAFYDSTEENELIDQKTTTMIQLASSFALGGHPCIEYYFGVAKEKGLTDEEIGVVQSIAESAPSFVR
jgi:alkylhydroperoxidase/carboxymuconolactone decarboxylase family protein YurZ